MIIPNRCKYVAKKELSEAIANGLTVMLEGEE